MHTQSHEIITLYQGSIRQRVNNRTRKTEWVFFLVNQAVAFDPKSTVWFECEKGKSWPSDEDADLMAACLRHRKNIAVRFALLDDALNFMHDLYPAGVRSGEAA